MQQQSVVILISGRGSNMEALVRHCPAGAVVRAVVSNREDAAGLQFAAGQGIATRVVPHREFSSREAFDEALSGCVDEFAPDWVVLAGFMRVLTAGFVQHYAGRLLNIHPSLLPSFPGLHTHRRALEAGVRVHGATVHFVTPELDGGPAILQAAVPVLPTDNEDTLAERVLAQEHRLYPAALAACVRGDVRLDAEGRVRWRVGALPEESAAALLAPPLPL